MMKNKSGNIPKNTTPRLIIYIYREMTIKRFLLTISAILILVGGCFNIKYVEEIHIIENKNPISNYFVVDKYCSSSYRGSSFVRINFNGKLYEVDVSRYDCPIITDEYFRLKLFYIESTDEVFDREYSVNRGIFVLCYTFALVIPLIGFIVYRKELDNHYSTM